MPPLNADLTVVLEGFDLSRFSSYVPGYNIERGRLAIDSDVDLVNDELNVRNKVVVDKLKLGGNTTGQVRAYGRSRTCSFAVAGIFRRSYSG